MVIPAMDVIDERLTTGSTDKSYKPCIRAALHLGKKTLNRYYNKTDASEGYRIAMGEYLVYLSQLYALLTSVVLHPRHKLKYFAHAKWQQDWIDTAYDLVRETYDLKYASLEVDEEVLEAAEETETLQVRAQYIYHHHRSLVDLISSPTICLIIFLSFRHLSSRRVFKTNLSITWEQIQKTSKMRLHGGTSIGRCICVSRAWPWTI